MFFVNFKALYMKSMWTLLFLGNTDIFDELPANPKMLIIHVKIVTALNEEVLD